MASHSKGNGWSSGPGSGLGTPTKGESRRRVLPQPHLRHLCLCLSTAATTQEDERPLASGRDTGFSQGQMAPINCKPQEAIRGRLLCQAQALCWGHSGLGIQGLDFRKATCGQQGTDCRSRHFLASLWAVSLLASCESTAWPQKNSEPWQMVDIIKLFLPGFPACKSKLQHG